ncbi:MAG: mechanosensitive ion channel family protein, partial [Flavitalea sp.]
MKEDLFNFLAGWPFWAQDLFLALAAIVVGLIIKGILAILARTYCRKTDEYSTIRSIIKHLGRPAEYFLPLLILNWAIPFMHFDDKTIALLLKINGILLIIAFAYLLMKLINVVQDYVIHSFDIKKTDNLRERKIRTQLQYLRKVIVFVIVVLATIAILLSFESLRR